jgi:hypothetical protein
MTTPTENPNQICNHCGQKAFAHYPQPSLLGKDLLVCPFATFEAETNLSGGVEGHAHSLRDHVSANQWGSSGKETGNPMPSENQASPAQSLSPAQEKLCAYWTLPDPWTGDYGADVRRFARDLLVLREPESEFDRLKRDNDTLVTGNLKLRRKLEEQHCRDCCCAQSWRALGVTEYDGRSIVEHIADLRHGLAKLQQPDPDADEALNRIVQSAAERIEHGLSYEGASSIEGIVRAAIKAARQQKA